MLRFVVRRLLLLLPILLGLSILVFVWVRALPGGPANALLGERASAQSIEQIREELGLNRPVWVQYVSYMSRVVRFDLGTSISSRRPVLTEINERFPATVELSVAAMIFAVGVGVPLGFLAAKRYQDWFDQGSLVGSLLGVSVPVFFLGLILKYVFAVRLGWLPSVGRETVTSTAAHPTGYFLLDAIVTADPAAFLDSLRHLILPAIALGTIPLAIATRGSGPDESR